MKQEYFSKGRAYAWVSIMLMTISAGQTFAMPRAKYTGPNRFLTKEDFRIWERPVDGLVDPSSCEEARLRALRYGVITQEEYESLKDGGAAPQGGYYPLFGLDNEIDPYEQLIGIVVCGCFHPETNILSSFQKGEWNEHPAGSIANFFKNYDLVHLTEDSDLSNFRLTSSPISRSTGGPEEKDLIVISVSNGRTLKLTERHPVLLSFGLMVEAGTLQENDRLLGLNAQPLKIIKPIARERFSGEVVNFKVASHYSRKTEHVIFAEGIAVGDLAWQSSLENEMNKIFLRK